MLEQLRTWWHLEIAGGNDLGDLVLFGAGLFLTFTVARIAQAVFDGRLRQMAESTDTPLDDALIDAIERPIYLIMLAAGIRLSGLVLHLPELVAVGFRNVMTVVITVFIAWCLTRVMDAVRTVFVDPWVAASETKLDDQLVPILDKAAKVTLWSMAILIAFSNLGYDIISLLTGLGIGGMAVALAAQATLSNVLGSVTIFADQPFQVDDLIEVGGHKGVVSEVGLRSCRIKTFEGHTVNIPNSNVVDSPVINLTVGERWRYQTTLGLVYDTTADQLDRAVQLLKEILGDHPHVQDPAVRFVNFGDSALELAVVWWLETPDATVYLDTLHEVNLAIKRAFDDEGLSMAFPSVSVYLEQDG